MDISIDIGKHKLNFRVSAIIENENKILIHNSIGKEHMTLPGGRVQDGENTIEALKREIQEETSYEVEYIKSKAIIENFFKMNDHNYHELLFVHEMKFKDEKVYKLEKIEAIEEEKKNKLEFIWCKVEDLEKMYFVPIKLLNILKGNKEFKHIINDERK